MTPKAKAKEPTHAPHGEGMSPEELHASLPADLIVQVDALGSEPSGWIMGGKAIRTWLVANERDDVAGFFSIAVAKLCCTDETNAAIQAKIDARKDVERRAGVLGLHANYVWNTDTPTLLARVEALEASRS